MDSNGDRAPGLLTDFGEIINAAHRSVPPMPKAPLTLTVTIRYRIPWMDVLKLRLAGREVRERLMRPLEVDVERNSGQQAGDEAADG